MPADLLRLEAAPDYVDQVVRALVDAIAAGLFAPGERLTQEDIARRLNVSRQPVLQALRLLKKDGLVEDAPGRGLQVSPLDQALVVHVYQLRGALDRLAAGLAARRRAAIQPALVAAGRRAVRSRDVGAMIEADLAFHHAVYAASGNPLLAQAAGVPWQQVRRAMGAVLQRSAVRQTVWDEHEAIAAAIAAGQAAEAERLMDRHTSQAGEHMRRHLTLDVATEAHAGPLSGTRVARATRAAPAASVATGAPAPSPAARTRARTASASRRTETSRHASHR
ncbi:MAG: GntR family transcriptional regulator [Burkholderiales bacterium]|nr:GntR family transcriptional regulator [Burkholderiales bacterium]